MFSSTLDLNGDSHSFNRITSELASSSDLYFALRYCCLTFCFCALWSWGRVVCYLQLSSLLTHFLLEAFFFVWHSNVSLFFFERKILSPLCFGRFCNYLWRNILAEYYIIYNLKKLSSWNQEIARKCTILSSGKGTHSCIIVYVNAPCKC